MQGTVVDLQKYINIAEKFGAILVVDNAHGLGVVKQIHAEYSLVLHVGTFSKACAGFGGYVCGNKVLVESIANFGRTQIYSTVLPDYLLFYNMMAFKFACKNTGKMLSKAKKVAEKYYLEFKDSAILIKEFESINATYEFQKKMMKEGIYVPAIRPPTVPKPIVRFSICL
jgi:8-amino-7-oxononanoate synthase